jgi:DNA-binding response OmpR family regulator
MATILVGLGSDGDQDEAGRAIQGLAAAYEVVVVDTGEAVLDCVEQVRPDLVVLAGALALPQSRDVCRRLRGMSSVPLVVLSQVGAEEFDRALWLELGADEYLTQPISPRTLLAHVRAVLRRVRLVEEGLAEMRGDALRLGRLQLDLRQHLVSLGQRRVPLKPREYDLLAFLMAHPGIPYTRHELMEAVWGGSVPSDMRTVDTHIHCLREKLGDDPANPWLIETVRGIGYRFAARSPDYVSLGKVAGGGENASAR